MMGEKRFWTSAKSFRPSNRWGKILVCSAVILIILAGSSAFAEQNAANKLERYRVFSLKNISADQGKKYLADVGVECTVSQLPAPNTLLLTGQPVELRKAGTVLNVVDSNEPFVVRTILPVSEANNLPSNEQITKALGGDISIGTFADPPSVTAKHKAVIDVHKGSVIAITTPAQLEKIVSAIGQLRNIKPSQPLQQAKSAEPNEAAKPAVASEQTKTSDNLYRLLSEAEKMISNAQTRLKTIEPNIVAAEQEQKASEQPSTKLESAPQAQPQPGEPDTAVVVPAPEKKETEQKPEPAPPSKQETKPAVPETKYEPASLPGGEGEEILDLNLQQEKLSIVDLLDLVGKYLHLDYMYDPTKVAGEVTLKIQGPTKVKDLYPLLENVLKFKGFAMTRKGNLVTVVPSIDALDIDPSLQPEKGKIGLGDVVITRLFNLKYIDTASAQNLLTNMKLGSNITPIPETGVLIITEYAYRMARIEELLEMVDKPGKPKQFKFRQLKYTEAKSLAPKVKALLDQIGTMSITVAESEIAKQPPPAVRSRVPQRPAPAQSATQGAQTPSVYLDADERTNRILMIGAESELNVVNELIDALDVSQQDIRTLRLYDIQHVGADEVKQKLEELDIISGTGMPRTTGSVKAARPEGQPTVSGAAETPTAEPQVIIIDSTNSLLVNATPEQHAQIVNIISYVDSETLEQSIPYEIYSLENQDPEELAEVVQKFIQETVKDKEAKIEKVVRKEENITIVPDKNTFSIIVYASRKNQEWIGKLIKSLDKRRPQVLIDVTLVEITKNDKFNLDLDLVSKFPKLQPGGHMDFLHALLDSNSTGFPSKRITEATTADGRGFYSDQHIQALLTAMQTKSYGRVLAQPKLLVNDNEKGTIQTKNTVYVTRTTAALPTQATNAVATGAQSFYTSGTSYDPYSSGITLDIKPHISEGDLLRLEVTMTRSRQATFSGTGAPPDTTENSVNTIVTVPNKSTIILGGMLQLDQQKGGSKVPLLGDIPLIGGLFRSTGNTDNQSKLYIFVKANILRPSLPAGLPDLVRESDEHRAAFEKSEGGFQTYQDWPGVKPQPMDPVRVLDAK
jgi:type II secretory pathway component GspD/PulD (secretin)